MKFFQLLFLLLILPQLLFSAIGDSYSNAEEISVNNIYNGQLKYKYPKYYYWYEFTAPASGYIHIYSENFDYDTDMTIYENGNYYDRDESSNNNIDITIYITKDNVYSLYLYDYYTTNVKDEFILHLDFIPDSVDAINDSYTTQLNTTLNENVFTNDNGYGLTITNNTNPTHGTLTINSDGSFTYTPDINYEGSDSFTYTVTDANGATDSATVTISIVNPASTHSDFADFTKRTSFFARGELVSIGNAWTVNPQNYTITTCNTYTTGPYVDPVSSNNADYYYCHYNIDGNQGEAATQAELLIPPNSTIKWAGLYWQALTPHKDSYDDLSIKIRYDGDNASYQTVTATEVNYQANYTSRIDPVGSSTGATSADLYSAFADVTELFQNQGWLDGNYTVATADVMEGNEDNFGVYGAWNLIVVYENNDASYKNFTIFDGWKQVSSSNNDVQIDIDGFYTPKTTPINAKVAVFTAEGDYNIDGDKLKAIRQSDGIEYEFLNSNNSNLTNQTFSSYVHTDGVRSPSEQNNNGIDIQIFDIGTGTEANLLEPEQSSMEFHFTSTGDLYFPSVIAFATEVYAPKFCYDYAYQQQNIYFTEKNDGTKLPRIVGNVQTHEPIEVKVYIRNQVESDIEVNDMIVNVVDINTSQAKYIRDTTMLANNGDIIASPIPDSDLNVSDSYIKDIPIGTIQSNDFFYLYYNLDPAQSDLNISLDVEADYTLTFDNGTTIPYHLVLGENMSMCSSSDFKYSPAKGIFNIVHNDYYNLDTSHDGPDMSYYNLPTQVSSRVGNFKVLSMDPENIDELKANSTIVAVDMIDASAFHDTNASCAELSSAITKRVWVQIGNEDANATSAPFDFAALQAAISNGNTDITTPEEFYKTARQNTAFRVSYNTMDENGSIPYISKDNNGNNITLNWREEWTGEECSTPMGDTGASEDVRNKTATYCNATSASFNVKDCMECIYGIHTKVVCSRDNFAIRPEAFKLHLKDQNQSNPSQQSDVTSLSDSGSSGAIAPELHLAAGYEYNLEVNATNHIDNTSTPGYTRSFNVDSTTISTYKWAPQSGHDVSGCNAPVDVNTSMRFVDGKVDVNSSLNNVGHYTLLLKDTSWTLVDYDSNFMTHHTGDHFLSSSVADCKTNSDLVLNTGAAMSYNTSNNDDATLNGCNITSNHNNSEANIQYNDFNVTFHPYQFSLAITPSVATDRSVPLAVNSTSYIYYADITQATDENMSYHLDGIISAQGESGSTLSNFVSACYSVPLNLSISTLNSRDLNDTNGNHVNYLARFHDLNTSAVVQSALDVNATDTTPGNAFVLSTTAAHFLKDLQGNMSTQLNLNYQRTKNVAINPSEIKFVSYKAECSNPSSDCTFDANLTTITTKGSQDLNTTVRHYYGRTHNPRQSFAKTNASVSYTDATDLIYYEVYCDGAGCDKSLLQNGATSQFSDDPRWLINTNHTAAFGLPGHANQKGYSVGSGYVKETASASGNHPDAFTLRYDGTRGYPYKTTMENDASGWLIYNKYNPAATKNSWDIEFTNASGNWAGVRETNTTTNRNAADLTNRRTLW